MPRLLHDLSGQRCQTVLRSASTAVNQPSLPSLPVSNGKASQPIWTLLGLHKLPSLPRHHQHPELRADTNLQPGDGSAERWPPILGWSQSRVLPNHLRLAQRGKCPVENLKNQKEAFFTGHLPQLTAELVSHVALSLDALPATSARSSIWAKATNSIASTLATLASHWARPNVRVRMQGVDRARLRGFLHPCQPPLEYCAGSSCQPAAQSSARSILKLPNSA